MYKNETRRTTNILNLEYIKYGNDPKTISVSLAVSNSLHNTVHIGMITSRLLENTETSKFLLPLTVTWRPMQIQRNPKHIGKKWTTRYNPPDIYRDFNENISNTPEEHLSIAEKPKTQTHLKHTKVVSSSLWKEKREVMNAADLEPMRRLNSITLITMKNENRTIWPSRIAHEDVACPDPGQCRNGKFPS